MQNNRRRSRSPYPASFRRQVAEDYLYSSLSKREIAEKYDLPSKYTVKNWVRWYHENHDIELSISTPMTESEKQEKQALEKRIKKLEAQLKEARLKGLALDTMIDVAEEMFDIEIRKKPGTKQSEG